MKNKMQKQTYFFALFYLCSIGAMGCYMPYINQYLQVNRGFTGSQLGTFTFMTTILGLVIVPLWGILADKTRKTKLLLILSLIGTVIATFFFSLQAGFISIILCGLVMNSCSAGMMPLADMQATTYATKNNQNYGFIRSAGSLGAVLGSILAGFIVLENDFSPMFKAFIFILLLAIIFAFTFPKVEVEAKEDQKQPQKRGNLAAIIKNKHFVYLCIISLLTVICCDCVGGYAGIHMVSKLNGGASSATYYMVFTALPEILLLGIIGSLFKKYGYKKIFVLNAMLLLLRFTVYFLATNIYLFLAASLVHCMLVGISTVGNLGVLQLAIPEENYGTAVSTYNAVVSAGRGIFALIFGYLLDIVGSTGIFAFCIVSVLIGTYLIFKTKLFDEIDQKALQE